MTSGAHTLYNRNHEKLKMDFRCRVILRTSIGREFNWLFVCDGLRLRKLKKLNHIQRFPRTQVVRTILNIFILSCFVLDAVFTCIKTDEMQV